jgi:hypothetical protein
MLPPRTEPLSVVMLETMLRANLASKISAEDVVKYNAVFERFVAPFGQQRIDGLAILHQVPFWSHRLKSSELKEMRWQFLGKCARFLHLSQRRKHAGKKSVTNVVILKVFSTKKMEKN